MTLTVLLKKLQDQGAVTQGRVKDLHTSLRYVAAALGCASPDDCHFDPHALDLGAWLTALETHFDTLTAEGRTISALTRRNTRSNLRHLLRLAQTHGLFSAPSLIAMQPLSPRIQARRTLLEAAPYTTSYRSTRGTGTDHHFGLHPDAWPADIRDGWQDYRARCAMRIRAVTFQAYAAHFALYFGYIARVVGRDPRWEDCFDITVLQGFVRWHADRVSRALSSTGKHVVVVAAAMAKVLEHPQARALADFRNTLPPLQPVHNKHAHWVTLAELDAIADIYLREGRKALRYDARAKSPGVKVATRFQKGVILKLMTRLPLRQRNIRELRLTDQIFQDSQGHWQLHLRGADLKVGTRGGRLNEYHVDLSEGTDGFVPVLEEFLAVHRPKLPGAATSPYLFLTQYGRPYSTWSLRIELREAVAVHTGKRFYPHLIRSIWATSYLKATGDFRTASILLGDTLKVTMDTYDFVIDKDHFGKAKAFLGKALQA